MLHDTSYKVVLRPDKIKKDGTMPIYIRIIKHRKQSYFSVGENCLQREFDAANGKLWQTKPSVSPKDKRTLSAQQIAIREAIYKDASVHPHAARINATINDKLDLLQEAEKELKQNKKPVSVKNIRSNVIDPVASNDSYIKFYYNELHNHIKLTRAFNTFRGYQATYNKLIEELNGIDLLFDDITYDYLEKFYLKLLKAGYKSATIKKHIKWMQSIWKQARKKKLVKGNPFEDFEVPTGEKSHKEQLTIKEIKALIEVQLSGRANDARNTFLFAFFHAGMRISDILTLKWDNIENGRVTYTMKKSKKRPNFQLNPIGKMILKQYEPKLLGNYIFPFLENGIDEQSEFFEKQIQSKTAVINKNLKTVAKEAAIKKHITTHISRHSYAGIALEKNTNAFDLSYSLQHSKIQTSDSYTGGANIQRMDKVFSKIYKDFK